MRRIVVIGIGSGDPDHFTFQAARALASVDVVFLLDKGESKGELADLRRELCRRHGSVERPIRFIEAADPIRREAGQSYLSAVSDWHEDRAVLCASLIRDGLGEEESGAFLVWGDPSLYDSMLRILDRVRALGSVPFTSEVIPGISSIQVLAARHGLPLNAIGCPVVITTGRRLVREGLPAEIREGANVVVMLDGETAFKKLPDPAGLEIFWGAYLGMPDEILLSGPLPEISETIASVREEAKRRKGWIMDVYMIRKSGVS